MAPRRPRMSGRAGAAHPPAASLRTGISVWATVLLEMWRLQKNELAVLWGVDNLKETDVVRTEFNGQRIVSRISGEVELHYPRWKRFLKLCVTIPVLCTQLLVMTGIIILLYWGWIWIYATDHAGWVKTLMVIGVTVTYSVLIEFLNWKVFRRIAVWLNNWENWRTTVQYEQMLVIKVFAFFFVDGFLWYFLLAFLYRVTVRRGDRVTV